MPTTPGLARPGCARPAPRRHALDDLGEVGRVARERARAARSTRPTKWSRSQGTAVNCRRCVTSCSASQSRNWLGAKPYCVSTATMFGPDVGDEVLVLGRLVVDQQVVLAEHACRHVGEHQAELRARRRPGRRRARARRAWRRASAASSASAGPTRRSMERTLAAAQPGRSVTLARAAPCARVQPGRLGDEVSACAVSSSNCACSAEER